MITTKKVKPTPKELFLILTIRYFKKRWWLFVWIWVLALFVGQMDFNDLFTAFFVVFALTYPFIIAIQFWRYVMSEDNKLFLAERYYEIDNEKINGVIDEGTYSPIKLEHFVKVEEIRRTYLLYFTKSQFAYIPFDAFENDSDREWFEKEIVKKIRK